MSIEVKPPTLRSPCMKEVYENFQDYMNPDKECCRNCVFFSPCMMSSPAGWCMKYPSEQVNCSEFDVCDDFDKRRPIIGKCLGNSISEQQIQAIRSGTYSQIETGDYWYINGVKYIVAQKNVPDANPRIGNLRVIKADDMVIGDEYIE